MDTLISIEEARARLLSVSKPSRVTQATLMSSYDLILAQDIVSRVDTPPFDRAMLDGFAVRAADVQSSDAQQPTVLQVIGDAFAGTGSLPDVSPGTAVRTMTGARLAPGADAIVRLEWARETQGGNGQRIVSVFRSVRSEEAVQRRGEGGGDGQLLAQAGHRLTPLTIGRLAAQGLAVVDTYDQPVVGVMTVGDELAGAGVPLLDGQVYDSNSAMLCALIQATGAKARFFGSSGDDAEVMQRMLHAALKECDALITIGGVSVGDRDLTPATLEALGAKRLFWGVWMRPGTPVYAASYQGKPVLACSGNPFAAWVNAVLLAWPMVESLQGLTSGSRQWTIPARIRSVPPLRRLKHTRFLQATLIRDENVWWADVSGSHSSALIPHGSTVQGLVRIDASQEVQEGDWVEVLFTQM